MPPEAPPDPLIGRTLGGHYRIEAPIGRGAMGVVYRARHTLLDQPFAVKVLAEGVGADSEVRRRFLLEAKSLTFFTHKHAVQVRHCGEEGGLLYLAMDLVPGETLAALLAREGPLPEPRAAGIALQVLDALDEAHRAGIVHRDLKPGNVMVEAAPAGGAPAADRVRVLDFGLARIVDVERTALPGAFASTGGNVVGTVAYMSPEQLRAEETVDGRSDLFSVGVVLYEMLTGRLPFEGKSTMSIALGILERDPMPLEAAPAGGVSTAMRAVLSRALAKSPARRFFTAGEFAEAIRAALGGTAPPALPPEAVPAEAPPPAPSRRPAVAIAAVVLVAAVVAALLLLRGGGGEGDRAAGRAALLDGRFTEATEAFGRLVAAGKATPEDRLQRAEARIALGDPEATGDLDAAGAGLPKDPRVLTAAARLAWRVRKPRDEERAEALLGQALSISPAFAEARAERVRLRIDADRLNDALTDLQILEQDPKDSRAYALRTLYETVRMEKGARPETAESLEALIATARKGREVDPRDADAALVHAGSLVRAGLFARYAGEHALARRMLSDAEEAGSEAIRRALADRGYRDQGRRIGLYYEKRGTDRLQRDDSIGAAADFREVLTRQPNDPTALGHLNFAERFTNAEGVKKQAQALHDSTGRPENLFDVAFAYQTIGVEKADVGDVAGAVEAFTSAIQRYSEGVALSPDPIPQRTYRGESHVLRARLTTGKARADDLDAAIQDFDASIAGVHGDSEVYLRRGAAYALRGDTAAALADYDKAVGGERGRNPRFYAELSRALLARAEIDRAEGRLDAAREEIARVPGLLGLAVDRMPEIRPRLLALLATVEARAAGVAATAAERDAHLARARALAGEAEAAATAKDAEQPERLRAAAALAKAEIAFAGGDPAGAAAAAGEAIALREREHAAKRWSLDAAWVERSALFLDAAGKAAEARAARERAASLPR